MNHNNCYTLKISSLTNTIENSLAIRVTPDGKAGSNTVEYSTAILYSDWLFCMIDVDILTSQP